MSNLLSLFLFILNLAFNLFHHLMLLLLNWPISSIKLSIKQYSFKSSFRLILNIRFHHLFFHFMIKTKCIQELLFNSQLSLSFFSKLSTFNIIFYLCLSSFNKILIAFNEFLIFGIILLIIWLGTICSIIWLTRLLFMTESL